MGRSPCCSKVGLKKGAWTAAEDKLLTDYIKVHGDGNWRALPKRAGLERCGKSCRLRWLNYLRPDIKRGNITEDEEDLIIRLHKLLGNRWSLIAGRLPGRTDNEIKNYWNTTLGKRVHDQSNSASTVKHSKQSSDKKKRTGMASRATPKPRRFSKDSCNSNRMETGFTDRLLSASPDEDNSSTKPNQTKFYPTRWNQLDEESSLTKPNQTKLYPTMWDQLDEENSLTKPNHTKLYPIRRDRLDEDNRLSEYITLEELHVSGFINPGLTGLLDFSYGNGHGHGIALSSSLDDDCLMTSDEMLKDWTKSDSVQPENQF